HLGMDDFAFRKRYSYGTVFVNHDSHEIVDLIDSRDKEAVTAHLALFENAKKVTRDGSPLYRHAIGDALPDAKQISDKFHLLKNLIDALKMDLALLSPKTIVLKEETYDVSAFIDHIPLAETKKRARVKAKQDLIEQVRLDYKDGYLIKDLERKYHLNYRTVKKYLEMDAYRYRVLRHTEMDDHGLFIYQRLKEGLNIHQIHKALVETGFKGSYPNFFKSLMLRLVTNTLGNTYQVSRFAFTKLLYTPDIKKMKLDDEQRLLLEEYLQEDNVHSRVLTVILEFRNLFEGKGRLSAWIKRYKTFKSYTNLQTFIRGIVRDRKAVNNQIKDTMTNGLVEGLVGKIKAIKRRTYGRCGFELLRNLIFLTNAKYYE
ncbi:MAG: transposase, partial [Candidatus Izemoplasmatales bacterium]|nr:transposase [Candidatus Izemoplasmatales bacterium]